MSYIELFFIAIGLSMDAFAVAVCKGLSLKKISLIKIIIVGLYFGIFQAGMPLIGYLVGTQFADSIKAFDHWIAFVLLIFIGGNMLKNSFSSDVDMDNVEGESLGPRYMIPLALATSIDALAVGVSFAFLNVNILSAVVNIGLITFVLSMIGVKIGNIFGTKYKSKAELLGGVILILIGAKILIDHTMA